MTTTIRLARLDDAPALAELVNVDRDFLAPWEPLRQDSYFTVEGQEQILRDALARYDLGTIVPYVILDAGEVVGRITLNDVVRGPFQSGNLGYSVASRVNGRGVASAAVRSIAALAFGELGLHRIQAATLKHNFASQKVLQRNGFERYGLAPKYLNIAGQWQDHILFQLIAPEPESSSDPQTRLR